jgi:hypothetical protein
MQRFRWIIVALLGALLLGGVLVYFNLGRIVRRTVESQATASLSVPTQVGAASVSIFGGQLGLENIEVSSPSGYTAGTILSLGGARVGVSYGELRKDPIAIDRITIDRPKLVIEHKDGRFNFKSLMDLQPTQPADAQTMKLVIRRLDVNDASVLLRPGIPGLPQEIAWPIASFTVSDVGTADGAKNGAAVKEVVMVMITAMASKAAEHEKLPVELRSLLKGDLESVARDFAGKYGDKLAGELKKSLPAELGGAIDAVTKGTDPKDAIQKGLQDLLGKDQKKKPTTKAK